MQCFSLLWYHYSTNLALCKSFFLLPPSLSLSGCRREDFDASLFARSRPGRDLNPYFLSTQPSLGCSFASISTERRLTFLVYRAIFCFFVFKNNEQFSLLGTYSGPYYLCIVFVFLFRPSAGSTTSF